MRLLGTQLPPDRPGTAFVQLNERRPDLADLYELDLATGRLTAIAENPGDVLSWLRTPDRLLVFTMEEGGDHVLSEWAAGDRRRIARFPGTDVVYGVLPAAPTPDGTGLWIGSSRDGDLAHVSCDATAQRWVVDFTHDRDPGVTWSYDHSTGRARRLFRPFPHLDPARLAPVTPISVTARDGLTLPCHLTLPVGIEPSGLPTVLLVHGGPWHRDSWGYDPEVQLLANRGYAVLQVDFRGSMGYGKAHTQAAIGQFAGRMHDDLIDALDRAIDQGYTDPDRVAIYGSSYGGYAALVGAAFTPDRFAAAVSYTGMSDLVDFVRSVIPFARRLIENSYLRYIGDPDDPRQAAEMLARSPISRVDHITAPVLLVHGANDVRVARRHSDRIVEALRARGAEVEYLLNETEGHWFINPDSNIELYSTLERFLAQHLGGRAFTTP